jgi:hypothetical protein
LASSLTVHDCSAWAAFRPEILATVAVGHEGGAYTMAVYFTCEAAAREGERKHPPPELQAQMDEMAALSIGEPEFFDLKQPWLHSHAEVDSPVLGAGIFVGFGRRAGERLTSPLTVRSDLGKRRSAQR